MIKYAVFGPEEFPYFYLNPADKEAPEISNKYLQKDVCNFGTPVRINRFFLIPGVRYQYTRTVSKYCNMYHNVLITRREILYAAHIYLTRRSIFLVQHDKQGSGQWKFPYLG